MNTIENPRELPPEIHVRCMVLFYAILTRQVKTPLKSPDWANPPSKTGNSVRRNPLRKHPARTEIDTSAVSGLKTGVACHFFAGGNDGTPKPGIDDSRGLIRRICYLLKVSEISRAAEKRTAGRRMSVAGRLSAIRSSLKG